MGGLSFYPFKHIFKPTMPARPGAAGRTTRRMLPTNLAFERMLSGLELTDLSRGKRLKSATIRSCRMRHYDLATGREYRSKGRGLREPSLTLNLVAPDHKSKVSFRGGGTIARVMQTFGLRVPERSKIRKGEFDPREIDKLKGRPVSIMLPSHLPKPRRFSPDEPIGISPHLEEAK